MPEPMGAVAVLFALVVFVGFMLAAIGFHATRRAGTDWTAARVGRWLSLIAPAAIALGIILPKRLLRAVDYEVSGRALLVAAAAFGVAAAVTAIARRERGGVRLLLAHVYFVAVGATELSELVFGAFYIF